MIPGLSLESVASALYREGDYTVRLFSRPKQYLFALLRFDGDRGVWTVRVVDQNLRTLGEEETARTFQEAKQALIDTIHDLLLHLPEYKITTLQTGYDIPPWLRRKRP